LIDSSFVFTFLLKLLLVSFLSHSQTHHAAGAGAGGGGGAHNSPLITMVLFSGVYIQINQTIQNNKEQSLCHTNPILPTVA
jgi:hypothetical protein